MAKFSDYSNEKPGCQLENGPNTETHYAPADISETSGDPKYGNSSTRLQPHASTWQEPLPSVEGCGPDHQCH